MATGALLPQLNTSHTIVGRQRRGRHAQLRSSSPVRTAPWKRVPRRPPSGERKLRRRRRPSRRRRRDPADPSQKDKRPPGIRRARDASSFVRSFRPRRPRTGPLPHHAVAATAPGGAGHRLASRRARPPYFWERRGRRGRRGREVTSSHQRPLRSRGQGSAFGGPEGEGFVSARRWC